jgi:hypothetical protein
MPAEENDAQVGLKSAIAEATTESETEEAQFGTDFFAWRQHLSPRNGVDSSTQPGDEKQDKNTKSRKREAVAPCAVKNRDWVQKC